MKARHDDHGVIRHREEQPVGKLPDAGAAQRLEHRRELQRVAGHAANGVIDFAAEAPAQARRFGFIPVLRLDHLGAGGLGEDDRAHLRAAPFEFGPKRIPRNALGLVMLQHR